MKKVVKIILALILLIAVCVYATGCEYNEYEMNGTRADTAAQMEVADALASTQKTPTDIDYSLERYNLIRRAYWVNGQREKANALICGVEKPLSFRTFLPLIGMPPGLCTGFMACFPLIGIGYTPGGNGRGRAGGGSAVVSREK